MSVRVDQLRFDQSFFVRNTPKTSSSAFGVVTLMTFALASAVWAQIVQAQASDAHCGMHIGCAQCQLHGTTGFLGAGFSLNAIFFPPTPRPPLLPPKWNCFQMSKGQQQTSLSSALEADQLEKKFPIPFWLKHTKEFIGSSLFNFDISFV